MRPAVLAVWRAFSPWLRAVGKDAAMRAFGVALAARYAPHENDHQSTAQPARAMIRRQVVAAPGGTPRDDATVGSRAGIAAGDPVIADRGDQRLARGFAVACLELGSVDTGDGGCGTSKAEGIAVMDICRVARQNRGFAAESVGLPVECFSVRCNRSGGNGHRSGGNGHNEPGVQHERNKKGSLAAPLRSLVDQFRERWCDGDCRSHAQADHRQQHAEQGNLVA